MREVARALILHDDDFKDSRGEWCDMKPEVSDLACRAEVIVHNGRILKNRFGRADGFPALLRAAS